MNFSILGIIAIITLFCLMIILATIGHNIGRRRDEQDGITVAEGAVFTLMALLVAFTFSNASVRFDQKRLLIIDETNAISTAYLRLDILPLNDRSLLQQDFKDYITSRINIYKAISGSDTDAAYVELNHSKMIAAKLWRDVINATSRSHMSNINMIILPPINTMFDIASTRIAYMALHLHYIIFALLILVALLSAFMIGYGTATRKRWLSIHLISYSLILSATIYIIIDMEFPRYGIIKASEFDTLLVDLKSSMKSGLIDDTP